MSEQTSPSLTWAHTDIRTGPWPTFSLRGAGTTAGVWELRVQSLELSNQPRGSCEHQQVVGPWDPASPELSIKLEAVGGQMPARLSLWVP